MKRMLSRVLTLVMLLSMLCGCATEAQAFSFWKKKTITVHAYVPSDWESPGCWAWSTQKGKDAFNAWPGEAMTEDGEWYVVEVPDWVNYIIINGNEGTVQTADLSVEAGRELWVVVENPETATVFYDEAQAVSSWKKKNTTVHAYVPSDWENPGCWAWSTLKGKDAFDAWPGEAMTEDGEWYVVEVPDWVNYIIINGNEGTVQTADLPVEAGRELWVVMDNPETATVFYEEAAALEAAEKTKGLPPDEIYAALGTLKEEQITDFKAVTCKYEIFDEEERSREVVLDYLTGVEPAKVPEEVRYLVNVKYQSTPALGYIGTVKVYWRSIYAEVIDVLTMETIGKQSFAGSGLPDYITSTTGVYFGDYPDETLVQEWILEIMYADRNALMETVKEGYLGKGYSCANLQATLIENGEYDAGTVRYVVENCGADWNNEALISAKGWLERGDGYTPQQLLENLVDISKFTREQAAYGVENCGADWNQEALKVAKYFLEIKMGYSHSAMIKVLVGDYGFLESQAKYAADNCGADWNQVAVDHVELFLKYAKEPYTRDKMIEEMVKYYGFTEEQAIYAVNKVGLK